MQLVDWRVATATATTLVPPGPRLPLADAVATVEDLRTLAAEADEHVRAFSALDPPSDGSGVTVVDRPGWIRSNVEGFRTLLDPLLDSIAATRTVSLGPVLGAVGPRATGAELGALLAYLATRV
ncbi:MAG TPA: zinc-dependent metalloprotease, partial [Mycobacteriales bacterium]|nr:zinc-dependent metalloprotease [Mycobacteriales bacterium]